MVRHRSRSLLGEIEILAQRFALICEAEDQDPNSEIRPCAPSNTVESRKRIRLHVDIVRRKTDRG